MDEADSARSEKLAWPIALLVQLRAFEALVGGMLVGALSVVLGAPWAASAMAIVGTLCYDGDLHDAAAGARHSLARPLPQWHGVAIDLGVMGGDFNDSRWPGFAERDVADRCAARLMQWPAIEWLMSCPTALICAPEFSTIYHVV